jgi:hypothetical protein
MPLTVAEYLAHLEQELRLRYVGKDVVGHDEAHIRAMLAIGPRITHLPGLDLDVFAAAVWLHNLDRPPEIRLRIESSSFAAVVEEYLELSPFTPELRDDIVVAVVTHSKKHDEPNDSSCLRALRAADKVSRLDPAGALSAAQIHGKRGLYDPTRDPFVVKLGEPGGWPMTVYDDFAGRLMEWPRLLPPEARYLISLEDMRALVSYIKDFAAMVCRRHGLHNGVEDDLRRALGPELYELYAT